jgi:alginate O-acetyltransferase complex protein AlgI
VSFFPHLIAGPLVHHAEMIPQFKRGRTGRSSVLAARGLAIFAAGLFKKVVIADNLAQFVSPVFAHLDAGGGVTTSWAWLATLAYTLQIYFDFSGYSDMAVGLALLFGIRLPVNFRSPYKAASIIEFWRRWHITLSRFLRDYLYIPLGGNRLGEQRRYLNLMVTMLLGGLWHGAGWNFLIWGGLHGLYLCVNHLWQAWRGGQASASAKGLILKGIAIRGFAKGLSWAITFFAVVIAWVFFRARSVDGAWQMLGGLFGFEAGSSAYASPGILRLMDLPLLVGEPRLLLIGGGAVALSLAIALCLPNVPQLFGYREYRRAPEQTSLLRWRPNAAWALVSGLALAISLFGMWQRLEFLYFQF